MKCCLPDLAHSIRSLAEDDEAGRRWSTEHRYAGYTSYASLNDLPKRDPVIGDLAKSADEARCRVRKGLRVRSAPQAEAR